MMDDKRLEAEKQVLSSKLPSNSYRFMDMSTSCPYIVMAAKTNSGNVYTVRIDLANFPNSKPEAFVRKMLYTLKSARYGNNLKLASNLIVL